MSRLPRLAIAEVVTTEHGETYVEEWFESSTATGATTEAFGRTDLVTWPDDREAHGRYHAIEDEITERIFEEVKAVAVAAFVRIASEVLARERGR